MVRRDCVASVIICSLSFFAWGPACSGLKRADDSLAAKGVEPGDDTKGEGDGGRVGRDAPDGGPPADPSAPRDFECAELWTKTAKANPECAPRQIRVITADPPFYVESLVIARTPAGRVGIAFNGEQDAESGTLYLVHFAPNAPDFATPKVVARTTGFAFHDGFRVKLAASAPDTLSMLSYDMSGASRVGEIHLRSLVAGQEPLTDDLMTTAVKEPTEIAVATSRTGTVYATARVATGAGLAKLSAWTKPAAQPFSRLPDVVMAMAPDLAVGIGSASIFVESGGEAHLLYVFSEPLIRNASAPRYHALAGSSWSDRKTIDNPSFDGFSGYSPRLATHGTKKYAAYFARKGPDGAVTAELRLATWESDRDAPQIEVIEQRIPALDALSPTYSVAMAVDPWGLVHLAILSGSAVNGSLEYRRQTRATGGQIRWLRDIIDLDITVNPSEGFVDMVVDENARPHIAYRSSKDGRVRYATRFDR